MTAPVLAFLDTTEITSDPTCSGAAWRILAHRPESWKVRVVTTEVVVEEAVANYRRQTQASLGMVDKFEDKFGRPLGLSSITHGARKHVAEAQSSYDQKLRTLLTDAGVTVIPPAKLSHMDLVRRATLRRKPCNQHGDGYRDTLNWLTLIQKAKRYPKSDIIWVTRNSSDFLAESGDGLHTDLLEDLEEAGISNVRLLNSVQDLAVELVANLGSDQPADLKQARTVLESGSLAEFVRSEVMFDAKSGELIPARCGLPVGTREARIEKIFAVRDVQLEVVGQAAESTSLARFSAVLDTDLSAEISSAHDLSGFDEITEAESGAAVLTGWVRKPLMVEGILTIGNYDAPIASEISEIKALPGDPGLKAWENLKRQSGTAGQAAASALIGQNLMQAFASAEGQNTLAKIFGQLADAQRVINVATLTSGSAMNSIVRSAAAQNVIEQAAQEALKSYLRPSPSSPPNPNTPHAVDESQGNGEEDQ